MKIQSSERVLYRHNPLAEVLCQVRFARIPDINDVSGILGDLSAAGYVKSVQPEVRLHFADSDHPPGFFQAYCVESEDGVWSASFNSESIALLCRKYTCWEDFLPKCLEVFSIFVKWFKVPAPLRVGLRYKDVIDRTVLGLDGTEWHELVQPFLLGGLSFGAFSNDLAIPEDEVIGVTTQSILRLDVCSVVLQSALMRAINDNSKTVFLIDSDFFKEYKSPGSAMIPSSELQGILDDLHRSAGDLFRRGIKAKLHEALSA